jgi:TolA-binding protein
VAPQPAPQPAPPIVAPAPPKPTVAEQQFTLGWAAFRANDFERAATELAAAADAGESHGETIAFDARYQEAVALVRAGHPAEAERAIGQFLARAGDTPRRGRAELLLARLLAMRHETARAVEEFQLAQHDPDPAVAAAATAELARY